MEDTTIEILNKQNEVVANIISEMNRAKSFFENLIINTTSSNQNTNIPDYKININDLREKQKELEALVKSTIKNQNKPNDKSTKKTNWSLPKYNLTPIEIEYLTEMDDFIDNMEMKNILSYKEKEVVNILGEGFSIASLYSARTGGNYRLSHLRLEENSRVIYLLLDIVSYGINKKLDDSLQAIWYQQKIKEIFELKANILSSHKVSEILRISQSTLKRYVDLGIFPRTDTNKKYKLKTVVEFILKNRCKADV
ncbi:MAG: hypothetical protein U9N59_07105 [Campylobacterota bacterium]|nr:hypothetical protein [Campylobacterota bacterium]